MIEFARLGRLDSNRRHRARRRQSSSNEASDVAEGKRLYAIYGRHLRRADDDPTQPERCSVQRFIERYGRGPYLKRITLEEAMTLIVHTTTNSSHHT